MRVCDRRGTVSSRRQGNCRRIFKPRLIECLPNVTSPQRCCESRHNKQAASMKIQTMKDLIAEIIAGCQR